MEKIGISSFSLQFLYLLNKFIRDYISVILGVY